VSHSSSVVRLIAAIDVSCRSDFFLNATCVQNDDSSFCMNEIVY